MFISYETRLKIESVAWKIANMDVDPVLFIESYVQFKSPIVLNEQGITNWWQNIKNYMKGGASGYYGGQVDIKSKYEEAKNAINGILQLLKSGPYKGQLDQAVEDQVIDHLEDVVNQMTKADRHVDHLSTRIQQSHKEKKMAGKDVAHAQSLPNNYFDDIFIVGEPNDDVDRIVNAVSSSTPEVKTLIKDNAEMSQRRISRKMLNWAESLSDSKVQAMTAGGAMTTEEAKNTVAYIMSVLMTRKVLNIATRIAANAPPYKNTVDPEGYAQELSQAIATNKLTDAQLRTIADMAEVRGAILDANAANLQGASSFAASHNAIKTKVPDPKIFAKIALYIRGMKLLQQSLS